jgi:hypothetical protein
MTASAVLLISICPVLRGADAGAVRQSDAQVMKNEELMSTLESNDRNAASMAAVEIVRRGEAMIPLLARRKGNKRYFYGYGLGNRNSSFLIPVPTGKQKDDEASTITIEVTALYLISAIFYGDVEFAQAPYLTDGRPVKKQRFNTRERVAKAWASVDKWLERCKDEELSTLREKGVAPLNNSGVRFWGTSNRKISSLQ